MSNTHQIRHDRPNCIGCNACASIAPEFWEMNPMDGRSDIIGSTLTDEGWEELEIDAADFKKNQDAAESCPVNVIHLIEIGSGKQLI